MPKIRGIKPETWTDDKFVSLEDPFARLLFIGMWNFACDNGHLDDNPRQIKLRVLPADDVDAFALIESLVSEALVERRDGFLKITNLTQHQSPDLRFLIFCDHCDRDEHATFARSDKRGRSKSARSAPSERTTGAPRNGDGDVDVDVDGDGDAGRATLAVVADDDRFEEWWSVYDKKDGKKVARQKWNLALKKQGVTAEMLIQAAGAYVGALKAQGKHPQFTKNPTTWLNGEHWEDEAAQQAQQQQARAAGWWN